MIKKPVEPMKSRGRSLVHHLAKVAFVALALILLCVALVKEWDSFVAGVTRLSVGTVVVAVVFAAVALICSGMSWRWCFESLGLGLSVSKALQVFFVSQIGKYIPGSVWPVLSQMEMAREEGFSRMRAATAAILSMIVSVVTAGSVAAVLFVLRSPRALEEYWYVLVLVAAGVAVMTPKGLSLCLRAVGRLAHRDVDSTEITGSGIVHSALWGVGMWVSYGVHTWVLMRGLAGNGGVSVLDATAAFSLAWVVGFLVVLAPAGVGVREAVIVVVLGTAVTQEVAFTFAVVSRVVLTMLDGIAASIGIVSYRFRGIRQFPSGRSQALHD